MVERLKPKRVAMPKLVVPTTSDEVYSTERWMRLSRIMRQRHRVCQQCELDLSTEVHHVIPIEQAPHLAFEVSNLRCLCQRCHHAQHHNP
jgi:5-methylcytosine-specific restriction endonuclease McrA